VVEELDGVGVGGGGAGLVANRIGPGPPIAMVKTLAGNRVVSSLFDCPLLLFSPDRLGKHWRYWRLAASNRAPLPFQRTDCLPSFFSFRLSLFVFREATPPETAAPNVGMNFERSKAPPPHQPLPPTLQPPLRTHHLRQLQLLLSPLPPSLPTTPPHPP